MSSSDRWLDESPLALVYPFQTWRKYGFAVWDDKRMVNLGMRHPRKASVISNSIPYSFRRFSILTEEDLCDLPWSLYNLIVEPFSSGNQDLV